MFYPQVVFQHLHRRCHEEGGGAAHSSSSTPEDSLPRLLSWPQQALPTERSRFSPIPTFLEYLTVYTFSYAENAKYRHWNILHVLYSFNLSKYLSFNAVLAVLELYWHIWRWSTANCGYFDCCFDKCSNRILWENIESLFLKCLKPQVHKVRIIRYHVHFLRRALIRWVFDCCALSDVQ